MAGVGQVFGGKGTFRNALLLFVWLEFLVVLIGIVQTIALFVLPLVGVAITVLTFALFLWIQVQFIKALHGFSNGWLVFLGMIGTLLASVLCPGASYGDAGHCAATRGGLSHV
jgi:hypothetical protein